MARVGINGFGRISRVVMRAALERDNIDIAAINWRNADIDYVAYLLKYDTTFGPFPAKVEKYADGIIVDGKKIPVFFNSDAKDAPWGDMGADYIMEGTGAYNTTEKAQVHLDAGAKKVIISAPAKDKITPTFVYGVNHNDYTKDMNIVSNASCTTNCLAPICKVLQDNYGIKEGLMSTIHAATAKQNVVDDRNNKDWRIGRSVFGNIIPTTTGAAKAVGLVIPEIAGKMTGISYRVPTADVSVVDLNIGLEKSTNLEDIYAKMKEASEGDMAGIIRFVEDPLVTGDFVGEPCASIFDSNMGIELNPNFFKLVMYYDNEYGYSTQMLKFIEHMEKVDNK